MNFLQITVVALILAVDATVYAFSYGMVLREHRMAASLRLALAVGLFQAAMPLLGFRGGEVLRSVVDTWAPWLVLVVFGALGVNIIRGAWSGNEEESVSQTPLGVAGLLFVGVATSIDALAVGACMALGDIGGPELQLGLAVSIIGVVTFACAMLAFHTARLLHSFPTRWLETAAGLLLVGLGVQGIC